ncbi:hypothetical protein [Gordonia crocea]|nr:hypothetical protein [Gordonia crocea]
MTVLAGAAMAAGTIGMSAAVAPSADAAACARTSQGYGVYAPSGVSCATAKRIAERYAREGIDSRPRTFTEAGHTVTCKVGSAGTGATCSGRGVTFVVSDFRSIYKR